MLARTSSGVLVVLLGCSGDEGSRTGAGSTSGVTSMSEATAAVITSGETEVEGSTSSFSSSSSSYWRARGGSGSGRWRWRLVAPAGFVDRYVAAYNAYKAQSAAAPACKKRIVMSVALYTGLDDPGADGVAAANGCAGIV